MLSSCALLLSLSLAQASGAPALQGAPTPSLAPRPGPAPTSFLGFTEPVLADASASPSAAPAVALLPFSPEKGVSKKEAARVSAAAAKALQASGDFLRPLPATKRDKKDAARCRLDAACLSDLAYTRGADLLASGAVLSAEGGLVARVVVVSPKSGKDPVRVFDEPLGEGKDALALGADRLLRRAFAPSALAGGVRVEGSPEGATVLVDGQIAGELPLSEPIFGLVEGEHEVTLRKEGYGPLSRRVQVRFREVSDVELVLTPVRRPSVAGPVDVEPAAAAPSLPWGPLALGGVGLASIGVGAGFGVATLMSQKEVERRATSQQLVFPRDANLVRTGESLSWVANGLYAAGALALAGAGGWWLAARALEDKPERETYLRPPAEGAPEEDAAPRRRLE